MKPPQVSLAETNKLLSYSLLQEELGISTVRELEDLIIEVGHFWKLFSYTSFQGISSGVALGKLDQKNSHFEVDFVIGRDIRKMDIGNIVGVLTSWCENCDSTLSTIETQVKRESQEENVKDLLLRWKRWTRKGRRQRDTRMNWNREFQRWFDRTNFIWNQLHPWSQLKNCSKKWSLYWTW